MNEKYVLLDKNEVLYGKESMLTNQLRILNIVKNIQNYKKLRVEEFELKILLKQKLDEAKITLSSIERNFPKVQEKEEITFKEFKIPMEKSNLEIEIENIKKKLSILRNQME